MTTAATAAPDAAGASAPPPHQPSGPAPLAITAAAAVTPAGVGLDALAHRLEGRPLGNGSSGEAFVPADPTDPQGVVGEETLPPRPALAVPELPLADLLGRKGLRSLDRTTKLALVAARLALDAFGELSGERTGVIVGTTTGSIRSSSEYSRQTLRANPPYLVNPSLFPNTVMNSAAGQIAIRHGLRGVNATLAGGALAGIQALRYARNAFRQGQADRLLVGGVEELCAQSCWGWHRSGALLPGAPVGEGAGVLMVEPHLVAQEQGRPVLARVLAAETGFASRGRWAETLEEVITTALRRSGVAPASVGAVTLGATGQSGLEYIELRAVRAALGGREPESVVRVKDAVGECSAAAGVLQIAALLGRWHTRGVRHGEVAVVPALAHDGSVGCAVVEAPDGLPAR